MRPLILQSGSVARQRATCHGLEEDPWKKPATKQPIDLQRRSAADQGAAVADRDLRRRSRPRSPTTTTRSQPKQYRRPPASTSARPTRRSSSTRNAPIARTTDLATLVNSSAVAQIAAKELGYKGNPAALLGAVTAIPAAGSDFVTRHCRHDQRARARPRSPTPSPTHSCRTKRTRSDRRQLRRSTRRRSSSTPSPNTVANQTQRGSSRRPIQQMQGIERCPQRRASSTSTQPRYPPGAPFAPNPKQNAIFAFVITLMLAIAGAYGLERLDRRIRKLSDIEAGLRQSRSLSVSRGRRSQRRARMGRRCCRTTCGRPSGSCG